MIEPVYLHEAETLCTVQVSGVYGNSPRAEVRLSVPTRHLSFPRVLYAWTKKARRCEDIFGGWDNLGAICRSGADYAIIFFATTIRSGQPLERETEYLGQRATIMIDVSRLVSLLERHKIYPLCANQSWALGSLGERRPRAWGLGAKQPYTRPRSTSSEQRTPQF